MQEGEHARPERAIQYYGEKAKRLIDQRGRGNYASAAGYLKRIQKIYQQQEAPSEWQECIREFREYASNLPACQDEFNKAGLASP